jgi:16S rRNA U1498 N3-methylase RsmE
LRTHGFTLVDLGSRVLRSETAVIAALTLVRAKLGLL